MSISKTTILSSKFRITIPKAIRTAHAWEAGLTFAFVPKGTGVLLVPIPKRDSLKGLARGASVTDYRDRTEQP
jgi:bifunctional DNA-binding transcriptional regulator/antitoxin component of YhaV-PrlF toxin-antitoxin module